MRKYFFNHELDSLYCNYEKIVFFDFETTGFSGVNDEIIEMAAVTLEKDEQGLYISDELNILVKLTKFYSLPPKITEITHITDQMLRYQGVERHLANEELIKRFDHPKTLVVAHNAPFDLSFLKTVCQQMDRLDIMDAIDVLDTLTIFRDRVSENHRLCDAVSHYHLDGIVQNTHRGIDDVYCLIYLLFALQEEQSDLAQYINLIGYNPKFKARYTPSNKLVYLPKVQGDETKLYEQNEAVMRKLDIA